MKFAAPAIFLLSIGLAAADDFRTKFAALEKADDRVAIEAFLEKSAAAEAENPEYYAIAGNYWWGVAGSIVVPPIPAGDYQLDADDLTITDPETGKKVGAIRKAAKVDPELPQRALKLLSDGAQKFPERADLALGLAHVQKQMNLRDGYVATLTALLSEAKKGPAALVWTDGGALPSPVKTFLPETVQIYSVELFNANTPATDALCAKLLSAVTDAFPDHPYAYNLKAALADATGKPEEALRMLETAHQKAPDDTLILTNVAEAYAKAGQTENAVGAYEKLLKLELDADSKREAEAALAGLRKKAGTGASKSEPVAPAE